MGVGGHGIQSDVLWNGLVDNNGDPLASGNVYIYQAGTTTNSTLYTTADAGTAHANPLVLDAYGRAQAYGNRDYKFIVTDVAGTTLYTMDDIAYNYWKEDNDGTASGLDADLLDGRHAGNTYNYVPVSNGTVNDELNADEVDGYDAGNATGQVAVNNGTVNAGLNATYLDGHTHGNSTGNIPVNNGTVNTGLNSNYLQGFAATHFVGASVNAICWAYLAWPAGGMTPQIYDSEGVATVAVNATCDFSITWTTPFAGDYEYAVTMSAYDPAGDPLLASTYTKTGASVNIITELENAAVMNVIAIGRQ